MSLEVALEKNTAALTALLAHIVGGGLVKEPSMKVPPAVVEAGKAIVAAGNKPTPKADAKETAQDPAPAATGPATPPAAIDYEKDVKPKALAVAKAKGRDALLAIIGEYGAANTSEVKAENWPALVAKLDAALK